MEKIQIYEEMDYLKKPYGEEMAAAVAEREREPRWHSLAEAPAPQWPCAFEEKRRSKAEGVGANAGEG